MQTGCTTSTATLAPLPISTFPVVQPTPETIQPSSGGEPRSAGYWLIWNTCAENNQSDMARANGGREAGWILMDDLLVDPGVLIGAMWIETCQQGLNILQSRNMQNVDMKNDATYMLAAQLFTAQLNLAVGSEYCSASNQAVNEAQLILLDLNFDGTGSYLGSPLANSEIDKAGELIDQLVSYNNGELCR